MADEKQVVYNQGGRLVDAWGGDHGSADEVEAQTEADAEESYDDLTNDQLRELLTTRDLPTTGNKSELVQRLLESDEADADEDEA